MTDRKSFHVILSDLHIPYHDLECSRLVTRFLVKHRPDVIHLAGDIIDCYAISRFVKDPRRKLQLPKELAVTRKFLEGLRDCCPKARIIYSEGNHEHRLEKYVITKAEELFGLEELTLPNLLHFDRLGIEWRPEGQPYRVGPLWIMHGDIVRKHSAYTARAMAEKVGGHVIIGHTHRMGASDVTTWEHHYTAWENGCLCRLDPEYVTGRPNWQQGFHTVTFNGAYFNVEPVRIVNRRHLLYRGDVMAA